MNKIYSRPRIRIPKFLLNNSKKLTTKKGKKLIKILVILSIAFVTAKLVLDSILPIFDTLCANKAKSIATIVSNEQATNVMKNYSYDELFTIEKDNSGNINMIRSNIIVINEIISDVANKIQEDLDTRGGENVEIALRKFYRL